MLTANTEHMDDVHSLASSHAGPAIETEGHEAFTRLRSALVALVGSTLGEVTAAELGDGLGLSRKLGWQVWRLAFASDPFGRAGVLPTEHSLEQVMARGRVHGAPDAVVQELGRAIRAFEVVRQVHAGSREVLEAMLRSVTNPSEPEAIGESTRREAHNANCLIWGSEVGLWYICDIFAPSQVEPSRLDMVSLSGLYGVRRLRPTGRCIIHGLGVRPVVPDPKVVYPQPLYETEAIAGSLEPLILPFCSQPIPAHRQIADLYGQRRVELIEGSLGDAGAVTLVGGEIDRLAGPQFRDGPRTQARFSTHFVQPVRSFVLDLIVHRDVAWKVEPRVETFGELGGLSIDQAKRDAADILPVACGFTHKGGGLLAAVASEIPQHRDLLRWTFRKTGWDIEEFDTYRLALRFPVLPSCLTVAIDLPDAPTTAS